jgi:hypothetical protein
VGGWEGGVGVEASCQKVELRVARLCQTSRNMPAASRASPLPALAGQLQAGELSRKAQPRFADATH